MNINDILTETEYTRERSAGDLFEYVARKDKELSAWSSEQPKKIKYKELSKGLPDKFAHELTPFAYYAKTYYSDNPAVRFKPCCGSEQYDGIIINNGNETFVEFTNAIFGNEWAVIKEVLAEKGCAPWEYDILGVNKNNRAKKKKAAINMFADDESGEDWWNGANNVSDCINKLRELVKKTTEKKCVESLKQSLKYGRNKTILIVTFDDTIVRPNIHKNCWDDFVDFKRTDIDDMKHNFRKIILLGWLDKKFIE